MTAPTQPLFEIRLYGSQGRNQAFRFWDEYKESYARYDAFTLVPPGVEEYAERVELRAATPPNSYSLGWNVREGQSDADVEIVSTGLYVIVIGPKLELVKYAWNSWMEGVTRNLERGCDVNVRASKY